MPQRGCLSYDAGCGCGRYCHGAATMSMASGRLRKRWGGYIRRQLSPAGLLQFRLIPSDVAAAGGSAADGICFTEDGRCQIFDYCVVDTTVNYSLDKQYRWLLVDSLEREMQRGDLANCSDLQVFIMTERFADSPGGGTSQRAECLCNLAWLADAQVAVRRLRKVATAAAAACASRGGRGGRRATQRDRVGRRAVDDAVQKTRAQLEDLLADDFYSSQAIQLPISYRGGGCDSYRHPTYPDSASSSAASREVCGGCCGDDRLLNLFEQLGLPDPQARRQCKTKSPLSPEQRFLETALSRPPKLIVRAVCRAEPAGYKEPSLWRPPPRRAAAKTQRRLRSSQRRVAARCEAAEGLADWLVDSSADDWREPVMPMRPPSPQPPVLDRFVDFSLATSRATSKLSDSPSIGRPNNTKDNDPDVDDQDFRPAMRVRRDLLAACGRVSDSWPAKFWLCGDRRLWPAGPTLVMEELPPPAAVRRRSSAAATAAATTAATTRVRLHLLGCGSGVRRRQMLSFLLADGDPVRALPRLAAAQSDLNGTVSNQDYEKSEVTEHWTNLPPGLDSDKDPLGVQISVLTAPPLFSWLYDRRLDQTASTTAVARPQRLPPLRRQRPPTVRRLSGSATAVCGSCGVACPRRALCDPADWLTALIGCPGGVHWHCHACWQSHVTRRVTQSGSGAVDCPTPGCGQPVDPATLMWFSPPGLFAQCLRHALWQPVG